MYNTEQGRAHMDFCGCMEFCRCLQKSRWGQDLECN